MFEVSPSNFMASFPKVFVHPKLHHVTCIRTRRCCFHRGSRCGTPCRIPSPRKKCKSNLNEDSGINNLLFLRYGAKTNTGKPKASKGGTQTIKVAQNDYHPFYLTLVCCWFLKLSQMGAENSLNLSLLHIICWLMSWWS